MTEPKQKLDHASVLAADSPRLIEHAFPLKQASIDSVHEKNVRHGHISTLHIWPARRPLAACRAALIASLLPDPGTPEKRKELVEKIGGKVVQKIKKKKLSSGKIEEKVVEETEGGILQWGREVENQGTLNWFREEIRKAYGGRAPRVLDPFAGGGAIPLEAMRLGCEVTAIDINPVAWFILKCTLEYPQRLAGQERPLPAFVTRDREFMESFFKARGFKGAGLRARLEELGLGLSRDPQLPGAQPTGEPLDADLAWHVRAWGWWVLDEARKKLAPIYPTYAEFEPLEKTKDKTWEKRDPVRAPTSEDGTLNLRALNSEFSKGYLEDKKNARWIPKPTVAYLWARTVACKNCRALIPLLKTRWLCKKVKKRVVLTMQPNAEKTGVVFGVQTNVPQVGGNAAQRREYDKKVAQGTMSRNGVWCPCCGKPGTVAMKMDDIAQEGLAERIGTVMTVVVVEGSHGKEYRPTIAEELNSSIIKDLPQYFDSLCDSVIREPIDPASTRSISIQNYGLTTQTALYTARQLAGIAFLTSSIRGLRTLLKDSGYDETWREAIEAYQLTTLGKLVEHCTTLCTWNVPNEQIRSIFSRFSLAMTWDFAEVSVVGERCGSFSSMLDSSFAACKTLARLVTPGLAKPQLSLGSAASFPIAEKQDLIVTDPPYYQAISYADLSDIFYTWLRRALLDKYPDIFSSVLTRKEDEIVQHIHPHKSREDEKAKYEDGMHRAFLSMREALTLEGRLAVVFAHKDPLAWETLVSSMIRAGFVVTASWPIQTERSARTRALETAALASSVWLVCKKRSPIAKPGWDNHVLDEMREAIYVQLREFWDAGIRGPDFVWAATGPALEAYSKHPVVKKANEPREVLKVSEFLRSVRRIVVDFVVGRVLSHNGEGEAVTGLDDVTTYYLLHRYDFRMGDAPIGACILYAISCGLSDAALADQYDVLIRTGGNSAIDAEEEEGELTSDDGVEAEIEEGTGSLVKLVPWNQRKRKSIGYEAPGSRPIPLIDQVHRLMQLWKSGEVIKVDEYLDARGLRRNALFHQLLQALIELAPGGSEERALLESISNHVVARGVAAEKLQISFPDNEPI